MKKLLIVTNVLFLGLAIFFYFQAYNPGSSPFKFKTQLAGTPGNTLSVPAPETDTCVPCKNYATDNFGGLPAGLAATMMLNYTNNYWPNVQGFNSAPDARSIWFSLDTLKKFIWHIENEVCKNGCLDKTSLGIRIYYGQYPDYAGWTIYDQAQSHQAKMQAYQKLHSVFMVPTYFKNPYNVDFDPRFISKKNGTCKAVPIWEVMAHLGVSFATVDTSGVTSVVSSSPTNLAFVLAPNLRSFVKNDGSLIPPPPPGANSLAGGAGNGAGFIDFMEAANITY